MQLALIDHLSRKERTSSVNNETQYRRVFRKTSKKWDAVPVMEKKNYCVFGTNVPIHSAEVSRI